MKLALCAIMAHLLSGCVIIINPVMFGDPKDPVAAAFERCDDLPADHPDYCDQPQQVARKTLRSME